MPIGSHWAAGPGYRARLGAKGFSRNVKEETGAKEMKNSPRGEKADASKQDLFPADQYPPTNLLAAAIKRLPTPGPDVVPRWIEIDAGPGLGRYSVIFTVRANSRPVRPGWFWGVGQGVKLPPRAGENWWGIH